MALFLVTVSVSQGRHRRWRALHNRGSTGRRLHRRSAPRRPRPAGHARRPSLPATDATQPSWLLAPPHGPPLGTDRGAPAQFTRRTLAAHDRRLDAITAMEMTISRTSGLPPLVPPALTAPALSSGTLLGRSRSARRPSLSRRHGRQGHPERCQEEQPSTEDKARS